MSNCNIPMDSHGLWRLQYSHGSTQKDHIFANIFECILRVFIWRSFCRRASISLNCNCLPSSNQFWPSQLPFAKCLHFQCDSFSFNLDVSSFCPFHIWFNRKMQNWLRCRSNCDSTGMTITSQAKSNLRFIHFLPPILNGGERCENMCVCASARARVSFSQ